MAQPSLSQQIRGPEAELGERLFERTSRRVRLTAAGDAFLVWAERVLAEVEGAEEEVRGFSGPLLARAGYGRGAAVGGGGEAPALLAGFGALHPGVVVSLREGSTKEMLGLLGSGEIDVALAHATVPGSAPPGMIAEELFSEELVLMVSPDHPLSACEGVRLGELQEEAFVAYEEGVGLRRRLKEAC